MDSMNPSEVAIQTGWAPKLVAAAELEALIEDCYPRIRRAALVLTGRDSDADDLAQETMLQALRSIKRFQGKSRFDTWLYGILLNQGRQLQRVRRRRERLHRVAGRWAHWLRRSNGAAPELEDAEWRASIWRQVAELPEPQRDCVFLRYSEGLSCEEISRIVDCPLGTVKSRIHHGLATLRTATQQE
jgi:RNA polymerase sigma-70 factor (ECF subfamily)